MKPQRNLAHLPHPCTCFCGRCNKTHPLQLRRSEVRSGVRSPVCRAGVTESVALAYFWRLQGEKLNFPDSRGS